VLRRFEKVVIPEMNTGQLAKLVRAEFLIETVSITKVQGQPLRAGDLERQLLELM
jgi:2-oxoglutarate ferredoxin oxidoreductase subunit alpha